MRIAVTGGAGFLGSHLCDSLLSMGHEIFCVDNLYTGSKQNIEHLLGNKKFDFIPHDVTFPLYLEVDGIFNMACPASPIHYQKNPVQTLKTSVHGAINLLGLSKRTGARILQASTSEIYGDPEVSPQAEDYWGRVNPIGIRACYDEGKRFAEALIYIYNKDFQVDTALVRIFNTYGPRMKPFDGRVVSTFIRQALTGEDITIFGEGTQTRSFCYVSDQIEGHWRLIHSKESGPINIGNPGEFTMLELAEKILQKTGSTSKLIFKPLPSDDPLQRCPDISKAKQLLNWKPTVNLDEGIEKTIEWFKLSDS